MLQNEWFYNILGAISYSQILRISHIKNIENIVHVSIYVWRTSTCENETSCILKLIHDANFK